ncbi:MAG: hypothetical protein RL139_1271 [Gemmatimonadota bacterium]|jgi:hypothetical protein
MTRQGTTSSGTIGTPVGTPKRISPELRAAVWGRDEGICGICHEPADPLEWNADHIVPFFLGGPTVVHNLRVTHPRCNRSRSRKMTDAELIDAADEWTANEFAIDAPTFEAFYAAHIDRPAVTDGVWTCDCEMCQRLRG